MVNTRFQLDRMFSSYNTGKQHFLSYTFSKIMVSLKAFLKKKKNNKNSTALNSQYFVTLDQSTPWQNNLTFLFLSYTDLTKMQNSDLILPLFSLLDSLE